MKYFARWQPATTEDELTALVFGFLRHAPVDAALAPWLHSVLGDEVRPLALVPADFWPRFTATGDGVTTEPDLVVRLEDRTRIVIVEVKPGHGGHTLDQLRRELADVTAALPHVRRADLLVVGADLGEPPEIADWQHALDADPPHPEATCRLHHVSFASIGEMIGRCAEHAPALGMYARDVRAQLVRKGLTGYEGAPVLDDLDGMSVANCVEGFNRAIRATRQFYLQLHADSAFRELGLAGAQGSFRMWRNGQSFAPTQPEEWFQTTAVYSLYRLGAWPKDQGVFVAFDLVRQLLCVGATRVLLENEIVVGFTSRDGSRRPQSPLLAAPSDPQGTELPLVAASRGGEFRYASRWWEPGAAAEDMRFTCDALVRGCAIWNAGPLSLGG